MNTTMIWRVFKDTMNSIRPCPIDRGMKRMGSGSRSILALWCVRNDRPRC